MRTMAVTAQQNKEAVHGHGHGHGLFILATYHKENDVLGARLVEQEYRDRDRDICRIESSDTVTVTQCVFAWTVKVILYCKGDVYYLQPTL
jgi:hypothetical protein